ncbi:MAG: NUDIX hydrolase [Magnetococcales bacterium]|nr:NUDIX hydrolase [Magnetococcales bacterium]
MSAQPEGATLVEKTVGDKRIKTTVSAHVLLVGRGIGSTESVLLVRLAYKDQRGGKWSFPGGFVDEGEELGGALLREVIEEVGVRLRGWEQVDVVPLLDQEHPHISFLFLCDAWEGEVRCQSRELLEAAWFDRCAFAQLAQTGALAYPVMRQQVACLGWPAEGETPA